MELEEWEDHQQRPHQDLDQYLNGIHQMESLFNETLTGILDLDVPNGYAVDEKYKVHSRKISGTAIFGYSDHGKLLSVSGKKEDEILVTPSQLIRQPPNYDSKPIHLLEEDEFDLLKREEEDLFVSAATPKAYKFPPTPSPKPRLGSLHELNGTPDYVRDIQNMHSVANGGTLLYQGNLNVMPPSTQLNAYNVKSLQEFGDIKTMEYTDDIEPLLDDKSNAPRFQSLPFVDQKYIPILAPAQHHSLQSPSRLTDQQSVHTRPISKERVYLPPPLPPTLSNGLPEWLLPEPQLPSPNRSPYERSNVPINPMLSSPMQNNQNGSRNFYTPQFFSDNNPVGYLELGSNNSLPYRNDLSLLPHKAYYQMPPSSPAMVNHLPILSPVKIPSSASPLRQVLAQGESADDLIDINATIVQLTPQKPQGVDLRWSPVILPSAKETHGDLRRSIQQLTPKKKVEKTSLLPPGELDQYWEGPDENKIFTCTYNGCGKKFTRRYNVRLHIQTHLSDRPFACMYCPKKFVRQHDLNRHAKGHQEIRYCRCVCGKEFNRPDALRKHKERNICAGGIPKKGTTVAAGVAKPKKRVDQLLIDEVTSDILTEELSSLA